jgi:tRNA(Leu) C34 or U34 (ribose-2'-O)-methylase TrmL
LVLSLTKNHVGARGWIITALSDVHIHDDLAACLDWLNQPRLFAITTKGKRTIYNRAFAPGDAFLFGSETSGLPANIHAEISPES